jgi:hypothetical protein
MTLGYQETASKAVPWDFWETSYVRLRKPEEVPPYMPIPQYTYETIGRQFDFCFFPMTESSILIESAWQIVCQTRDQNVSKEAGKLLDMIQEAIISLQPLRRFGIELSHLPPLQAFNVDDGSILIEWIFDDFRVGFSIEPDPKDSGWYLVSNENLGTINASGYTSDTNLRKVILWLLDFALSNS